MRHPLWQLLFTIAHTAAYAENFSDILQGPDPVLVLFTASWCGPCQQATQEFSKAAVLHEGRVRSFVVNCDTDDNRVLCSRGNVSQYPTVLAFVNSRQVRYIGPFVQSELEKFSGRLLEPSLYQLDDPESAEEVVRVSGTALFLFPSLPDDAKFRLQLVELAEELKGTYSFYIGTHPSLANCTLPANSVILNNDGDTRCMTRPTSIEQVRAFVMARGIRIENFTVARFREAVANNRSVMIFVYPPFRSSEAHELANELLQLLPGVTAFLADTYTHSDMVMRVDADSDAISVMHAPVDTDSVVVYQAKKVRDIGDIVAYVAGINQGRVSPIRDVDVTVRPNSVVQLYSEQLATYLEKPDRAACLVFFFRPQTADFVTNEQLISLAGMVFADHEEVLVVKFNTLAEKVPRSAGMPSSQNFAVRLVLPSGALHDFRGQLSIENLVAFVRKHVPTAAEIRVEDAEICPCARNGKEKKD